MDIVYGSGQIVGVEQFYTYFTYVAIYVVNVGIIFLLAPRGDFSHVEMCTMLKHQYLQIFGLKLNRYE